MEFSDLQFFNHLFLQDSIEPALQFTIFGVLSLTAGLLNLVLDETLNRTLPETMEDMTGKNNLRNVRGRYARLVTEDQENSDEEEIIYEASEEYKSDLLAG